MAKVISPLFSFGASGQLAKSIVFFPWKGLNVVRQWVAPANPKTTSQVTHRGYMTAAVAAIHAAMVDDTNPFNACDKAAYATLASLAATPRTWFNAICRQWLKQSALAKTPAVFHGASVAESDSQLVVTLYSPALIALEITGGDFFYGTTKTTLLESVEAVCTPASKDAIGTITGLTNGTRYFVQFRASAEAGWVGDNSGIFSGVPAAA
ncbi:unnamed protein product [marine sediment metagenome]|uniref:Uncharacterized protein n=1 Tax=marine sediment metagenome TaxID=412755 RepID=X1SWQ7_9ZZZZ